MVKLRNNRSPLVVLDNSVFDTTNSSAPSLTNMCYGGIISFQDLSPEEVQERHKVLDSLEEIENPVLIDQVRQECERNIKILNGQSQFVHDEYSPKMGKKASKIHRHFRREHAIDLGGEPESVEEVRTYAKRLTAVLRHLTHNLDPQDHFVGRQKHLYNMALKRALIGHSFQNGKKLGDRLETDSHLIATTIALSYDDRRSALPPKVPVYLLTRDEPLKYSLLGTHRLIKQQQEKRRAKGERWTMPTHPVVAATLDEFNAKTSHISS